MDYPQALVSIIMLVMFITVGLPLWWNTTKVYRADLPLDKISVLQNSSFKLKLELNIFTETDIELSNDLKLNEFYDLDVKLEKTEKTPDMLNHKLGDKLEYFIYFYKSNSTAYTTKTGSLTTIIYLKDFTSSNIVKTVKEILQVYLPSTASKDSNTIKKTSELPLSSGYRINFVLAIGDPSTNLPSWKPDIIVKRFRRYLKHFDFLEPIHLTSQVLYYADVGVSPKFKNGSYYYNKGKLPLLINPLESRLNTYTSSDKVLQFVIYVPPESHSPLFIKQRNDKELNTNVNEWSYDNIAFHSPRWGGIYIYNMDNTTNNIIASEHVVDVFLDQFNQLAGVNIKEFQKIFLNFNNLVLPSIRYEILKLYEQLQTSISTLVSLTKLLNEIPNIVIRDEIATIINSAVRNIELCKVSMVTGKLKVAHIYSKEAFVLSEKAFFDASLLGLLYFPDDQKYAIYVPLFLPISIPVLLSFIKAVKFLRNSNEVVPHLKKE